MLTRVVLVTVKGAVPVATFDTKFEPETTPDEFKFATFALPFSVNKLVLRLYVKSASPSNILLLLNCIVVFEPPAAAAPVLPNEVIAKAFGELV